MSRVARRIALSIPVLAFIFLLYGCTSGKKTGRELPAAFDFAELPRTGPVEYLSGRDNPLAEPCLQIGPAGAIRLPGMSEQVPWDKAGYLLLDVYHAARVSGTVRFQFFEQDEQEPSFSARLGVMPELRTRLTFPLSALDAQTVFLPRTPGTLKGVLSGRKTRPELISTVRVSLDSVVADQKLFVSRLELSAGPPQSYPMDAPPVVDSLGQWARRDWPGKTPDVSTLTANLAGELASAGKSSFPSDWSKYGGWKKLRFKPSGFFRVEKTPERWWLVDPEGFAFFSAGVDGVSLLHASCPVAGIEPLFEWIPDSSGIFAPVCSQQRGRKGVDFAGANLIRAFGDSWREDWTRLTRGRMIDWRFNTLGNWSDEQATRQFGLPYVVPLRGFARAGKTVYRDFPDVFDPAYEQDAARFASQLEPLRDDPLLIGYFLANEPLWAFGNQLPAAAMLESGEPSATRSELARWLKERYNGDISSLNAAWAKQFGSFEDLESGAFRRADQFSDQASEDLEKFSELMVLRYLDPVCAAVRRTDPNHLNFGIRWAGLGSSFCTLAGQYCDVFTVNMYGMLPDTAALRRINEATGKPILIGEYHFGATDRGLPSTGLRGVPDQAGRGVAYRAYVETAAALPWMVGTHYFIWNDQPVFGRFDGENYNIGVVDVCNTPYREFVEAIRETHERIYVVASGKERPVEERAIEVPRVGF